MIIKISIVTKVLFSVLLGVVITLFFSGSAEARNADWETLLFSDGGSGSEAIVTGMVLDEANNIFTVGSRYRGVGVVTKLNSNGSILWQNNLTTRMTLQRVAVDITGNVYVGGFHDMYPHTQQFALIQKYDSNGNLIWSREFNPEVEVKGMVVNTDGLYVSGTTGVWGSGNYLTYVKKIDFDGNVVWTSEFGSGFGSGRVWGGSNIGVDRFGYVYVSDNLDLYKLDSNGNQIWVKNFYGGMNGYGIGVSQTDELYFVGLANFQYGFLNKYDLDGNLLLNRSFEVYGTAYPSGIGFTSSGNIMVSGNLTGNYPGQGTALNQYKGFVYIFNNNVDPLWVYQFPSSYNLNTHYATGVTIYSALGNNLGGIVVAGVKYISYGTAETTNRYAYIYSFPPNVTPIANAGPDISTTEGQVSFDGSNSTDLDGLEDIKIYQWDFGDGTFGTGKIASHDYPTEGTYSVKLTVTDFEGLSDEDTLILNIINSAPTVTNMTAPIDPILISAQVNTTATFTDEGVLDTHTAIWDWGDGNVTSGAVTETNGMGSVTGSHLYQSQGIYTISFILSDNNGGSDTQIYEFVVVFNPDGGSVRGGGTIFSPVGAYTLNPSLSGEARFGFSSKYMHGASVPDGNTRFSFKVGDFKFVSTSYDWLVVAGARAQYKGSGQINSQGDYGFMLTGVDGSLSSGGGVDKFRIKIWDKVTGNIIYDNQQGDSDTDMPTTSLQSGSVRISQ